MPKIFISYRRADSLQITGRIYDKLVEKFGQQNVFKDVHSIPAGEDFRGVLHEATADCDIMLVVIGSKWLNIKDSEGVRRLDNPQDFVRLEVEAGLYRRQVKVIPLLVEGAEPISASQLPDSLKQLAYNNAFTIHNDPVLHRDLEELVRQLKRKSQKWNVDWKWVIGAVLVPIIVALITMLPSIFQNYGELDNAVSSLPIVEDVTSTIEQTDVTPFNIHSPLETESQTPTNLQQPTYISTETVLSSPTSLQTSTNIPISQLYPCEAKIITPSGSFATSVNQVRLRPSNTSSFSSAPANPQLVGATIIIIRKDNTNQSENWYEIRDEENNYLGWLEGSYLELSNECPN